MCFRVSKGYLSIRHQVKVSSDLSKLGKEGVRRKEVSE
jgi:hypothetical protein